MERSSTIRTLALLAVLAVAACDGDEPEETQKVVPAKVQVVDIAGLGQVIPDHRTHRVQRHHRVTGSIERDDPVPRRFCGDSWVLPQHGRFLSAPVTDSHRHRRHALDVAPAAGQLRPMPPIVLGPCRRGGDPTKNV